MDARHPDAPTGASLPFESLYRHGFVRVAVAIPAVRVADPAYNAERTLALARDTGDLGDDANRVLRAILDTPISPELVPGTEPTEQPAQSSEVTVGPYELTDFALYHLLRFGYRPSRIAYLAHHAWRDRTRGRWPDLVPTDHRHDYDLATIKHWLGVFLRRFVETSQFKRSALPNGPKVGSGGSLSPRGDWRAPSDATARAWLDELERNVPA